MNSYVVAYVTLGLAILSEVIGSSLLQRTAGFTRLGPTVASIAFFLFALFLLSHAIKLIPLGVAYAIWCGIGIVLTASVSVFIYRATLDTPALIGIGLIIAGVVVMNVFSHSAQH